MKRIWIVLISVFLLSGCIARVDKNNEDIEKNVFVEESTGLDKDIVENEIIDNVDEELLDKIEKYEFVNSVEGYRCSVAMLSFAKHYLNNDSEAMNLYLTEDSYVFEFMHDGRTFEDVRYILIKGLVYDEERNIAHAQLEYAWDDIYMNYYIDISMMKIDDNWVVVNVLLDA